MEWKLNSEQGGGQEVSRDQIKVFIIRTETFGYFLLLRGQLQTKPWGDWACLYLFIEVCYCDHCRLTCSYKK